MNIFAPFSDSLLALGATAGPIQPINAELAVEVTYPNDESAIEALQQIVSQLSADFIDVAVVFMRETHPALVAIGTGLLVVAATVAMVPGVAVALGIGYGWTYAYGGGMGVGFGTLACPH